jgi:hypothetical protein
MLMLLLFFTAASLTSCRLSCKSVAALLKRWDGSHAITFGTATADMMAIMARTTISSIIVNPPFDRIIHHLLFGIADHCQGQLQN